jgi:hypothetical protein
MNVRHSDAFADDGTGTGTGTGMVPSDDIAAFLQSWEGVAATLIDHHLNVTASTPLALMLFPALLPGVNLVRVVFLEAVPGLVQDCARELRSQVVAALHASLAWHEDDAEFERIVGELSTMSREFSTAWAAEGRALRPHGGVTFSHQVAGRLDLGYQLLELAADSNDVLIVWQGSDVHSRTALAGLASRT